MGCDIHTFAEVKINGKWKPNPDKIFPNPDYDPKGEYDWNKAEFYARPDDNRSYDWFAILADVRNGRGFAGVATGDGFEVIAEPRGIPSDASKEWKKICDDWSGDMHSISYLTIEDFDNFNWNKSSKKQGVITLDQYKTLRGTNNTPQDWCYSVWGKNTATITPQKADNMIDNNVTSSGDVYVTYSWTVNYKEWFENKIKNVVEPLRELTKKYGEARILFGFDN